MRAMISTNGHGWKILIVPTNAAEEAQLDEAMARISVEELVKAVVTSTGGTDASIHLSPMETKNAGTGTDSKVTGPTRLRSARRHV